MVIGSKAQRSHFERRAQIVVQFARVPTQMQFFERIVDGVFGTWYALRRRAVVPRELSAYTSAHLGGISHAYPGARGVCALATALRGSHLCNLTRFTKGGHSNVDV